MWCAECSKEIDSDETFMVDYKPMCHECATKEGVMVFDSASQESEANGQ